ncbi:sensor histidine kinase [Pseudonocardia humida]|uniref:histidine kinase n=1 Tax=Pseudonocardia humida TaxID=2800819 RepID=A0ABT1A008_9PSEU|nr:HAMP domain-containing sensor histidine kinase [Pseudonocardia humida]MCO1656321.1 HAMP domain-containing histidine kinase [Pseudonocardia humida]
MRNRIVTLTLAVAAIAIALFGIPLAIGITRSVIDQERTDLNRIADLTARAVQPDLIHDETPDTLPGLHDVPGLALYDHHGRIVLGSGPTIADDAVLTSLRSNAPATDDGDDLVVAVPISDGHEVAGVVRAARPAAAAHDELLPIWMGMLGLAAAVMVGVWLLTRRYVDRLTGPLERLSINATRLGDGDFSVRSPATGIREIDAVGSALDSTAGRLDDLLAREREFAAEASHQLRTPLSGLRLKLEAALDQPGHDLRRVITDALGSADRLQSTIEELLLLAREGNRRRGGPLAIGELVADIRAAWADRLTHVGRAIEVQVAPHLPPTPASAAATRQIIAVLLDNAAVHGSGTVRLTFREIAGTVAIDVGDDGDGLPPDASLPLTPGHGSADGLGLALAERLAGAEGARLVLTRPAPPVFTLFLPVGPPPVPHGSSDRHHRGAFTASTGPPP